MKTIIFILLFFFYAICVEGEEIKNEDQVKQEYLKIYSKLENKANTVSLSQFLTEIFQFQTKDLKKDYSLVLFLVYLNTLDVEYDPKWKNRPIAIDNTIHPLDGPITQKDDLITRNAKKNRAQLKALKRKRDIAINRKNTEQLVIRRCEKYWYKRIVLRIKKISKEDKDLIALIDKKITNKTRQDQIKKDLELILK